MSNNLGTHGVYLILAAIVIVIIAAVGATLAVQSWVDNARCVEDHVEQHCMGHGGEYGTIVIGRYGGQTVDICRDSKGNEAKINYQQVRNEYCRD